MTKRNKRLDRYVRQITYQETQGDVEFRPRRTNGAIATHRHMVREVANDTESLVGYVRKGRVLEMDA